MPVQRSLLADFDQAACGQHGTTRLLGHFTCQADRHDLGKAAVYYLLGQTELQRGIGIHQLATQLLAALDEIERVTDRRGWRRWLST